MTLVYSSQEQRNLVENQLSQFSLYLHLIANLTTFLLFVLDMFMDNIHAAKCSSKQRNCKKFKSKMQHASLYKVKYPSIFSS